MHHKQNAIRGGVQGGAQNNDANAQLELGSSLQFSSGDPVENFIRLDLSEREPA
jgi:hypothetical protein